MAEVILAAIIVSILLTGSVTGILCYLIMRLIVRRRTGSGPVTYMVIGVGGGLLGILGYPTLDPNFTPLITRYFLIASALGSIVVLSIVLIAEIRAMDRPRQPWD